MVALCIGTHIEIPSNNFRSNFMAVTLTCFHCGKTIEHPNLNLSSGTGSVGTWCPKNRGGCGGYLRVYYRNKQVVAIKES